MWTGYNFMTNFLYGVDTSRFPPSLLVPVFPVLIKCLSFMKLCRTDGKLQAPGVQGRDPDASHLLPSPALFVEEEVHTHNRLSASQRKRVSLFVFCELPCAFGAFVT